MFKLTAFFCLLLVGMLYAAQSSCLSCGEECVPSCGTRRYRACCFNYLRKKRGDTDKFWAFDNQEDYAGIPAIFLKYTREDWSDILARNSKLSFNDDTSKNRKISS